MKYIVTKNQKINDLLTLRNCRVILQIIDDVLRYFVIYYAVVPS